MSQKPEKIENIRRFLGFCLRMSKKYCIFAAQKFIYSMSREQSNRIAYLVACVGAFAERHGLSNQSSYQYLRLYKGTDFLRDYYDIEHTFSIDEAVEDLTVICQRNGGALA